MWKLRGTGGDKLAKGSIADDLERKRLAANAKPGETSEAFLGGETSDEEGVSTIARASAWVDRKKVRFDGNSVGWQTAFDQLAAYKICGRDVSLHFVVPGAGNAVRGKHGGDSCARETIFAVTAMHDSAKGDEMADAILTYFSIAQKRRFRTNESIVLHCLGDRHASRVGRIVNGR